ncbi:3-dehydroquinate synthase [Prevotella sp.]|uniref:3-dehydroquinate synthase n=1 Tax=Prevotella sp. TaxID=59823 RepID=UPI002F921050
MKQQVIISQDINAELSQAIAACEHDKLIILTDTVTHRLCLPLLHGCPELSAAHVITIPSADVNKSIESLTHVWQELGSHGATRHSCLINLGGGMVTDLGGFAASTFKRGINFINIPTTLLAMVDASVGGKTGINFNGLKNEIGVFGDSRFVILDTHFLHTLDAENICSGYAEMLKHGLISNAAMWAQLVNFDLESACRHEPEAITALQQMVADSVAVKEHIVTADPHEHGLRKALNLGHTFGHAFESWSLRRKPVLHGYAVAWGLVAELYLSAVKCGFPTERMRQTVQFIHEHYGRLPITCADYAELIELMHHDKKNRGNEINVTLLQNMGELRIDQTLTEAEIKEALDFFREG